jgi:hypothetical protein
LERHPDCAEALGTEASWPARYAILRRIHDVLDLTFETVRLIEEGAIAEALLSVVATSLTCGTAAVGLALASM